MKELFNSWKVEKYKQIRREKEKGVSIKELNKRFGKDTVIIALSKNTNMSY